MTFDEWEAKTDIFMGPMERQFAEMAWNACYTAFTSEICEKCGQTRQQAGGGCIHCITEWCKDNVREAHAERDELVSALEGVLPWVVTQVVACHGLKCREAVCESCSSEAYESAEEAARKCHEAEEALAKVRKP